MADKFMSPLTESAHNMHELFLTWIEAGFSEAQSLELVKTFLLEAVRVGTEMNNANPPS